MAFNFGNILGLVFKLAVPVTKAIEDVHGQSVSGADKKTMATTALNDATAAALSVLPDGSNNAAYAQAESVFASYAIDVASSIVKVPVSK